VLGRIATLWSVLAARRLSPAALRALRDAKLRAVVRHAYARVPYYRERLDDAGIAPDDVRGVADLPHLPVTTKRDLMDAGPDATRDRELDPRACALLRTSGSTLQPLRVERTRDELFRHDAVQFRMLLQMGLRPRDRMAVVSALGRHDARLHQRLGLFRSTNVSRLLPPGEQILALQRFRPTVVWGYATALREILDRVDYQLGRVLRPSPRMLISAGEVMEPLLRERIRADFDPALRMLYGSTEVGLVAADCPAGAGLHVNDDHVVLECLDGRRAAAPGELGEAVVTTLDLRTTPLLRYRVGDVFAAESGPCACGSPFSRMGAPRGRPDDALRLPGGRTLWPADCDAFSGLREVQQYRFVQERPDRIALRVRLREDPGEETLPRLRKRAEAFLGEPVDLSVEIVERFAERRIKFRTFVSRIPAHA